MKTLFVKDYEQKRDWYIIDAAGKPLGRVAAKVAAVVRGKNKASYTPNQAMGDDITVKLKGGDLVINYTDETVYMTGEAERVFEGTVEV